MNPKTHSWARMLAAPAWLLLATVPALTLNAQQPRGVLFNDDFEAAAGVSPYTIQQQKDTPSFRTDSDPNNAAVGSWATYGGEADGFTGLFGVQVTSNVDPPFTGSFQGSNVLRIFRSPVGSGSAAAANFAKTQIGGKIRATWLMMVHPAGNHEAMIHFSGTATPGSEGFDTARVTLAIFGDGSLQFFEGQWRLLGGLTATIDKWQTHQLDVDLDNQTWEWSIDGVSAGVHAGFGNAPGNTAASMIFRGGGAANDLFYIDTLQIVPIVKPVGAAHTPADGQRVETSAVVTYSLEDGFTETLDLITDTNTIQLFINGSLVTPDVLTKVGDTTTISYAPPGGFTPETTNTVRLIFGDTQSPPKFTTNDFSFVVLPALGPNPPRQQESGPDGLLVLEAEDFERNVASLETPFFDPMAWELVTDPPNFSGTGAMQSLPDMVQATLGTEAAVQNSPRLDYKVRFVRTGTHYIWVRGYGVSGAGDSVHVGLDGGFLNNPITGFPADPVSYVWSRTRTAGGNATMVPSVGYHFITVWMRENGFVMDKILITSNPNYVPTGVGPSVSPAGVSSHYWPSEEASGKALDVDGAPPPYPGTFLGAASRSNAVFGAVVPFTGAANTKSMNFTGGDGDAVDMGATNLDAGAGDFTLQAWINARTIPGGAAFIAGKRISGLFGDKGYELLARSSGGGFTVEVSLRAGGPTVTATSGVLNLGQWYHVAAVRGGGNLKLYVDGVLAQSVADPLAGVDLTSTQHFSVGGGKESEGNFHKPFDGLIDEVRLSLSALPPDQFLNVPLPTRPQIVSRRPAPGATGVPGNTNIVITLVDGTLQVVTNSIQLSLNGVSVSPMITQSNATTTVSYDPPGDLAAGSVNAVQLIFSDNGTPAQVITNVFSFTIAYVPISGPSYWRFEEASGNALDSLGPFPGVLSGGAVRDSDVPVGTIPQTGVSNTKSMLFDGAGAAGTVGTAVDMGAAVQVATNDFTLECYVKVTGDPNSGAIIVGKLGTGLFADKFFSLNHSALSGGTITFTFGMTGGNSIASGPQQTNQWYHLAGVRQGDTIRLYVDGTQVASATLNSFRDFTSDQRFAVAGGASGGIKNFKGLVDEVRLSNTALTPAQFLNSIPLPSIALARSGNQLTLSWGVAGFALQENDNLSNPAGWQDVPGGNVSPSTVSIGIGNKFFRLIKR